MWCEHYKPHILRAISSLMPACPDIIWRTNLERLRQDGLIEPPTTAPAPEHPAVAPIVREDAADIVVQECGVKFFISRFALTKGQKTGHYADQRENRAFLRLFLQQKASPARVLDLFCYTGGFALSAALAHHENQVVGVDSSARAIDTARRNAELNGVEKQVEFIQGDVVKVIRSQEERSYDVVIVDPPKFAPNVKALKRATYKYQSLNMQAIRMLKVGGLLFTCTCSAAMTKDRAYFIDVVRCAAREVGRELTLVKTFGAATDHPIAPEMLELEYLTVCLFVCR